MIAAAALCGAIYSHIVRVNRFLIALKMIAVLLERVNGNMDYSATWVILIHNNIEEGSQRFLESINITSFSSHCSLSTSILWQRFLKKKESEIQHRTYHLIWSRLHYDNIVKTHFILSDIFVFWSRRHRPYRLWKNNEYASNFTSFYSWTVPVHNIFLLWKWNTNAPHCIRSAM